MKNNPEFISLEIAKLIIRYSHNLLSEQERGQLDNWLCETDDNLVIYEELTEDLHNNVFDPDSLIIDTESVLDIWMIAGLIARDMRNYITPFEKKKLREWIEASEHNRAIYNTLNNPANLHKFNVWFKQWMEQGISPTGLN